MSHEEIARLLLQVDGNRLREYLFHIAKHLLPFRKLNHTIPGHTKSTLDELDDFLQSRLESWGYPVWKEGVPVRARAADLTKPKAQQYGPAVDPVFIAHNVYAEKRGTVYPDEIILFLAHKDSQSWVDSPGAYDNGVGTVAVLEIARVLKDYVSQRTFRFLFCNEEHAPWTSVAAAEGAKARGDNLIAIFNIDGIGGKPQDEVDAGLKPNTTLFTEPEGERFADLMAEVNKTYGIGLTQRKAKRPSPGDDDGSFIKAGFPMAVINIGSWPYRNPDYHAETDVPERVDFENVRMATQASLAAGLHVDSGLV
jgi:hypothetical protein